MIPAAKLKGFEQNHHLRPDSALELIRGLQRKLAMKLEDLLTKYALGQRQFQNLILQEADLTEI